MFDQYRQFIQRDSRYQNVRELYTETEALIALEAETIEHQPERPGQESEPGQKQGKPFPVLKGLRRIALGYERQHVLLAGRPGSGKSTALQRLLLELANAEAGEATVIPVYVQLKSDRSITDLILAEFRKAKVRVTLEQLDDWLLQDQLLLLLDGVNEIPSEERRRQLQDFRDDNPTTPMIFTTRDLSVGGDLGIEKRLEMRPLREPQMREFVGKYLANRGMPDQADTLLRQLRDRLREIAETPLLLKLLCDVFDPTTRQIPQSKGELFRQFDQKYDRLKNDKEYVFVSDHFWDFKAEILQFLAFAMIQTDDKTSVEAWYSLSRDRAETLLETWLKDRGVIDPATKAKLWLKDLRRCHLLQDAKDPGDIEFHHQLFQEYYAAEYLLRLLPTLSDDQLKQNYLNLLKWTEPIALMLPLVKDEERALRVVELAIETDVIFGGKVFGEIPNNMRQDIDNWMSRQTLHPIVKLILLYFLKNETAFIRALKLIDQLLDLFDSKMCCFLIDALESFLIEGKKTDSEMLAKIFPKILFHQETDIRKKSIKLFGNFISYSENTGNEIKSYVELALILIKDKNPEIRTEAISVLSSILNSNSLKSNGSCQKNCIFALAEALRDSNSNVVKKSVKITQEIFFKSSKIICIEPLFTKYLVLELSKAIYDKSKNPLEGFFLMTEESNVETVFWVEVFDYLNNIGLDFYQKIAMISDKMEELSIEFETLLEAYESRNHSILSSLENIFSEINRKDELYKLIEIFYERFCQTLFSATKSQHPEVRWDAIYTLRFLNNDSVISRLFDALEDEEQRNRSLSIDSLRVIGSEKAVQGLIDALSHNDPYVCRQAAYALSEIDGYDLTLKVAKAIEDCNVEILERVSYADQLIVSEHLLPGLLARVDHQSQHVQELVIKSLEKIGGEGLVIELLKALNHYDYEICRRAEYVLRNISGDSILSSFLDAIRHSVVDIRRNAVIWITQVCGEAGIPGLLIGLNDKDEDVRYKATMALDRLNSEQTSQGLLIALKDNDIEIRALACVALGRLGTQAAIPDLILALDDSAPEVRCSACHALGEIGDEQVVSKLFSLIKDMDAEVRSEAYVVLGSVCNEEAVTELILALHDEDDQVRRNAQNQLERVGGPNILADMWQRFLEGLPEAAKVIETIQDRCQFYNYEIWQKAIKNEKLDNQNEKQATTTGQTTNVFNIETLQANNSAINLGGTIQRDQIGTQNPEAES